MNTMSFTTEEKNVKLSNFLGYENFIEFNYEQLEPGETKVFIWNSNLLPAPSEDFAAGHIAIEFRDIKSHLSNDEFGEPIEKDTFYISFWTEHSKSKLQMQSILGKWHKNREEDYRAEAPTDGTHDGTLPHRVYQFRTLNTETMYQAFEKLLPVAKKFHALALNSESNETFNCIKAAITILKAGGIEKLAEMKFIQDEKNEGQHEFASRGYSENILDKIIRCCCVTCRNITFFTVCIPCVITRAACVIIFECFALIFWPILYFLVINKVLTEEQKVLRGLFWTVYALVALLFCCSIRRKNRRNDFELEYEREFMLGRVIGCCANLCASIVSLPQLPYDELRSNVDRILVPDGDRIIQILTEAQKTDEMTLSIRRNQFLHLVIILAIDQLNLASQSNWTRFDKDLRLHILSFIDFKKPSESIGKNSKQISACINFIFENINTLRQRLNQSGSFQLRENKNTGQFRFFFNERTSKASLLFVPPKKESIQLVIQ